MNRRNFIRTVAGGVAAVLGLGVAGCGSDYARGDVWTQGSKHDMPPVLRGLLEKAHRESITAMTTGEAAGWVKKLRLAGTFKGQPMCWGSVPGKPRSLGMSRCASECWTQGRVILELKGVRT